MAEQILMKGVRLFSPKSTQPDFVLASGVITLTELETFVNENPNLLTEYNGQKQLKIQLLKSKDGKPYMTVDTWKPSEQTATIVTEKPTEDLPF
jgi:hypothetical protein